MPWTVVATDDATGKSGSLKDAEIESGTGYYWRRIQAPGWWRDQRYVSGVIEADDGVTNQKRYCNKADNPTPSADQKIAGRWVAGSDDNQIGFGVRMSTGDSDNDGYWWIVDEFVGTGGVWDGDIIKRVSDVATHLADIGARWITDGAVTFEMSAKGTTIECVLNQTGKPELREDVVDASIASGCPWFGANGNDTFPPRSEFDDIEISEWSEAAPPGGRPEPGKFVEKLRRPGPAGEAYRRLAPSLRPWAERLLPRR